MSRPATPPGQLTATELAVVRELALGRGYDEIATRLGTNRTAAARAIARAKDRLNVTTSPHLVARAIGLRLIPAGIALTPAPTPAEATPATPAATPPIRDRRPHCIHGALLGVDICPGCDTETDRRHKALPITVRPPWASHNLLRCRRCGWHPAAPHHTDAAAHGPLPDPRTEAAA